MNYALRAVVGLLLAVVAGCAATEPDPKPTKFCSPAFCAAGVGLVGKMVKDNEDFITYLITYDGVSVVLYEGGGILINMNGQPIGFSGTNWSVYEDEGAWIADIEVGSRWPPYIRVSASAKKYSREQFLEALSTISVKTESG